MPLQFQLPAHWLPQIFGSVAFWAGFVLLGAPVLPLLAPEQALLWQKFVHVLGGPWACVGLGAGLLFAAVRLLHLAQRARQSSQEASAAAILQALRNSPQAPVPDFFLYLRAFETTGRLRVPLFIRLRRASLDAMRGVTDDLESHVSQAVRSIGPLVALGRPGEAIGADRIATVDDTWQADVDLLIQRSRGVLLVPSDRPGTLWEIQRLAAQGLLPKVIFIMPPRTVGDYDSAARWNAARTAAKPLGLELPPYDGHGLLFELNPQGQLLQVEALVPHARRTMRKAMLRLLDTDPPGRPLGQMLRRARRSARRATLLGWGETLRQLSPYALAAAVPWVPPPGPAFDPADGWELAFTRSVATESIASAKRQQAWVLQSDPALWQRLMAYQSAGGEVASLAHIGLTDVSVDVRSRWFLGRLQMLERMSTERCAASIRNQVDAHTSLSYLVWREIDAFVEAETDAVLQGAQLLDRAVPPFDRSAWHALLDHFAALLDPQDRARLNAARRALESRRSLDAADTCWLWRALLSAALRDSAFAQRLAEFLRAHAQAPSQMRR